ncbi:OmpA family protein [Pseudomonas sp. L7]|uniref:OmpA family protein n=1 Tax=Pseudomonas sp. L7 TaxID=3388343 RepID=UPI0039846B1D
MQKTLLIPALLTLGAIAGCSHAPNAQLEQARVNLATLQSDPQASQVAAVETKEAEQALDQADLAYLDGEDEQKVSHLAYLGNQRVEVARQTVTLRVAEADLRNASALRAQAKLEAREAQIRKLRESLNAKQTPRGTVVTFGDVLFDFDKASLRTSAHANIGRLAQYLNENPERKVIVEGFTDSKGPAPYNLKLSDRRATSVQAALVRAGVDPRRIVVRGYGEDFPVAENADSTGRAQNRRVEVTISNDDQPVTDRRLSPANF